MADLLPVKFHPPKDFQFPKRKFGSKGEERSFRAEWCTKFPWLHYDSSKDIALCHVCMRAEFEKKFLASTKRDVAFLTKGFTYWKEATSSFTKHQASSCHKEAIVAIEVLPEQVKDVGEMLSQHHQQQKSVNRVMFLRILENIRFLARQGLALRGHGDDSDSNFVQLLHLRASDCPDILPWLNKKTNNYVSPVIQNECLKIMYLQILRQISSCIQSNRFYSIMADECTDSSNKEQFTLCIRWVDKSLVDHEDFIGLYEVPSIQSDILVAAIKDVLLRMNLTLSNCRGQCYDGAANMTGSRNGVAVQLREEESRAVLTHCYGHALNLAVGDTLKQSKVCRDAMDVGFEISKLIRFSPKRSAALERIKLETGETQRDSNPGIRAFCPTRWTVRADAIDSILSNYSDLNKLWEECLGAGKLDPDVKSRIIGVQSQMSSYNLLFGFHLCLAILRLTDNLSRTLQKQTLSAADGQSVASLTVQTLESMRSDDAFRLFYARVEVDRKSTGTDEATLPRKRRAPARLEVGTGVGYQHESVEEMYRHQYFEAIDLAITGIKDRFNQPGYCMYRNLEELLVHAANQKDYSKQLDEVLSFYADDVQLQLLQAQLQTFASHFASTDGSVSLGDCLSYLRELSDEHREFYSELCTIARLLLVLPATNAISERSFSAMRRIKSYLRSTMLQGRLNHLMFLNIHKDLLDGLSLKTTANEFVRGSEHRLSQFGKF